MGVNLALNSELLESTDQPYVVYTSDCIEREVLGSSTDPKYFFYLGGCDYPAYPSGLPEGVTQTSFEYAGGVWSNESADGDPNISRSIMLDASNPLLNFHELGRTQNPTYGGSGGVTQVVYIGQTEAKPFRVSGYCKGENLLGSPKMLFDAIGYDGNSGGESLTFLTGTHDWQKLVTLCTYSFPVKYMFLHFSAQNMTEGKAWFAKPKIEEIDLELITPDPKERTINPVFNHSKDEVSTVAWETTNCERFYDTETEYLNPYNGVIMKVSNGGSLVQKSIIVSDIVSGIANIQVTAKSLGVSNVKITITARGRHRNKLFEKVKETSVNTSSTWVKIREKVFCNSAVEKLDIKIENMSGDVLLVCGCSITDTSLPSVSKETRLSVRESEFNLPALPQYDDTLAVELPSFYDSRSVELAGLDENYNGNLYLTNGKLGSIIPFKEFSNYMLLDKKPLTKISDFKYSLSEWGSTTLSETEWIESLYELATELEEIDTHTRSPHINSAEATNVSPTGGVIVGGDKRYYAVSAINDHGESYMSPDMRIITPTTSNTNKVFIEITPVVGAKGYKIYLSKTSDNTQKPSDWGVYIQDYVIWGESSLLDTITSEQLRENGYLYYDDGSKDSMLQLGSPKRIENTARMWVANYTDKTVDLQTSYFKSKTLYVSTLVTDYTIQAIKYVPDKRKLYIATNKGVFESHETYHEKLYKISDATNVFDLEYNGSIVLHTTQNQGSLSFDNSSFTFDFSTGVLTTYDSQGVLVSTKTLVVEGANFIGFKKYYDQFVTYNRTASQLVLFDKNCNVINTLNFQFLSTVMWDLNGIALSILMPDGVIKLMSLCAEEYFAELNDFTTAYRGIHYPHLCRPHLPDEPLSLKDGEMIDNGDFRLWDSGYSAPKPVGFHTLFDAGAVTNMGMSDDIAVPNTKAQVYKFSKPSWGSINLATLRQFIDCGVRYELSFYSKSTIQSAGNIGITFYDENEARIGSEQFTGFTSKTTYNRYSVVFSCDDINVKRMSFRILYYGSDVGEVLHYTNAISVKPVVEVSKDLSFEYLSNGDFTMYSDTCPIGWGISGVLSSIMDTSMGGEGKSLKITTPPDYNSIGETILTSPYFYDLELGDKVTLSFDIKTNGTSDFYGGYGLEHYDEDGHFIASQYLSPHITKLNEEVNHVTLDYTVNQSPAKCRFKMYISNYGCDTWLQNFSFKPTPFTAIDMNVVKNPDFANGLTNWYLIGDAKAVIADSVRVTASGETEIVPHCGVIEVDYAKNPAYYGDIRQDIVFNQTEVRQLKLKFRARCVPKAPSIEMGIGVELVMYYMDGTSQYNNFPTTNGDYTNSRIFGTNAIPYDDWVDAEIITAVTKPIAHLLIILWGGFYKECIAYFQKTTVEEIIPESTFDGLELVVPQTTIANPITNPNFFKDIAIKAQLTNGGIATPIVGKDVVFTTYPSGLDLLATQTNTNGVSKAKLRLGNFVGTVSVTASLGGVSATKTIEVISKPFPVRTRDFVRPTIKGLPNMLNKLYIETFYARPCKKLPKTTDKIGIWEVFQNSKAVPAKTNEYDTHWANNSVEYYDTYRRPGYITYQDYLTEYPKSYIFQDMVQNRDEWRCVEATGYSQPFGDGRSFFNWKDPECKQWYSELLTRYLETELRSDGMYMDDFWGESYTVEGDTDFEWGASPSTLLNYHSQKERLESQGSGMKLSRKEYHKKGWYLTANYGDSRKIDYTKTPPDLEAGSKTLADPLDGYLREVWLIGSVKPPSELTITDKQIRDEVEFLRYCHRNNKFIACLGAQLMNGYESRMLFIATLLLGKGDYTYFAWRSWDFGYSYYGNGTQVILPEQVMYVGNPVNEYQYDSDGFFSREFDNCVALVNVNASGKSKTYTLPEGTWYSIRNESFTGSITVAPKKGYVLLKERL